jgi:hypothetical protein
MTMTAVVGSVKGWEMDWEMDWEIPRSAMSTSLRKA